jgi:hypothetical protein
MNTARNLFVALGFQCAHLSEGGHLRGDRPGDLEVWNFAVTLPKRR